MAVKDVFGVCIVIYSNAYISSWYETNGLLHSFSLIWEAADTVISNVERIFLDHGDVLRSYKTRYSLSR